jgi:hypothetical protein
MSRVGKTRVTSAADVCIKDLLRRKMIGREEAEFLFERIRRYALNHRGLDADARLILKMVDDRLDELKVSRAILQRSVEMSDSIVREVSNHPDGALAGAKAKLAPDTTRRTQLQNVYTREKAIAGDWFGRISELASRMRTRRFGTKQEAEIGEDIIFALYGEKLRHPEADGYAKVLTEIYDDDLHRVNAAGGKVKRRGDYRVPQPTDATKVMSVGSDEFVADVVEFLDPTRMFDEDGLPLTAETLPKVVAAVHKNVTTGGLLDQPMGVLGKRHMDPRVFAFKDATSWLAYQRKYGHNNVWGIITKDLESRAHELAQLEVLGPNPEIVMDRLREVVRADAATRPDSIVSAALRRHGFRGAKPDVAERQLNHLWDVVSGQGNIPGNVTAAQVSNGARALLMSAQLGSATLSSVTDLATIRATSAWVGMPTTRVLKRMLDLGSPSAIGGEEARKFAVRLGLGAQSWASRFFASSRLTEELGPGIFPKASEVVMRASGLSAWTDSGRWAFGMEFMGWLADNGARSLDELAAAGGMSQRLAETMQRYGITPADWDLIRRLPTEGFGGANYVTIDALRAAPGMTRAERQTLVSKLLGMIHAEMDNAVPTPGPRARAALLRGSRPGTLGGELVRAVGMYRSFPVTFMMQHLNRGWDSFQHGDRGRYLGALFIQTTLMGAAAYQAKNVVKGRDPIPMDTAGFWGAAALQGGGLGLFGDFIAAGVNARNRYGNTFLATAAGPMGAFLEDSVAVVRSGITGAVDEDTPATRDAINIMTRYVPGQSVWYARTALDRVAWDTLRQWSDPVYARKRARRQEQYWQREMGVGQWWRPGSATPSRLPDFGNVVSR